MGSFNQIQPVPQVGGTVHQQMLHRLFGRRMLPNFGDHWKEFLVCFLVSNMNLLRVFLNPQNFPETRIAHEKTPSQKGNNLMFFIVGFTICWQFYIPKAPWFTLSDKIKWLGNQQISWNNWCWLVHIPPLKAAFFFVIKPQHFSFISSAMRLSW